MNSNSIRTWTVALTGLGSLMAALDTLVVSTALPTIRLDLGASIEGLEWTVNAYNLSLAVLLIPAAALGDRYGRRLLYGIGIAVFALASAACALAPSIGALIAARAVQGAGAALVLTLALALVTSAFPPERRGAAIGMFSAVTGLSVASGPLVGGAVVEGIDWEWIFWLNVPIGLLAVPLVLTRMKESFGRDTALDIRGLGLVSAASFATVWGLVRGNGTGWDSVEVLAALGSHSSPPASWHGSAERASRCFRLGCSARAGSRPATPRCSSPSRRSSPASSSSRSCSRRRSASGRSTRACG
jgi:MFS family permease